MGRLLKFLTPKRRVLVDEAKRMHKWFLKSNWFARGGDARVYRKHESKYPVGFFKDRGDLVKVYKNVGFAKFSYWSLKIAHELFPENTVRPRALRYNAHAKRAELHVDEVPVHKELLVYQSGVAKKRPEPSTHNIKLRKSPDYPVLELFQKKQGRVAEELTEKMARAGLYSGFTENATNVSLANPAKPIFFESQVGDISKTIAYINDPKNNISPAKKKKVEALIKRFNSIPEFDYEP